MLLSLMAPLFNFLYPSRDIPAEFVQQPAAVYLFSDSLYVLKHLSFFLVLFLNNFRQNKLQGHEKGCVLSSLNF